MRKTTAPHSKKRQISDLRPQEIDMVYSLARIGEWPISEIARACRLSEADVQKVFDNYEELRDMLQQQPHPQQDTQRQSEEQPKRKKRSDARFETAAEKQKAYRLRLKERQRVGTETSPSAVTDLPSPAG